MRGKADVSAYGITLNPKRCKSASLLAKNGYCAPTREEDSRSGIDIHLKACAKKAAVPAKK